MSIKKLSIIGCALVAATSVSCFGIYNATPSGATEEPPIYVQVANHEQRISSLEGRADQTEVQVTQNTNDLAAVQAGQLATTKSAPASSSTPTVQSEQTATTPVSAVEPVAAQTFAPAPTPDPRTIIRVDEDVEMHGTYSVTRCIYATYDGTTGITVVQQNNAPCYSVGTVLPE